MSQCGSGNSEQETEPGQIQSLYTELAQRPEQDFGWNHGKENARSLGYDQAWLDTLPDAVWASCAAVGNPFSLGSAKPGETVVDMGCGSGADVCIAALLVGKTGRVAGIDCTAAMVEKTIQNAKLSGFSQVEVYESDIAHLPLPDHCTNVVISNGSINLCTDKIRVLRDAFRVLRPGGRLQIADMVREPGREEITGKENESWAGCVRGTLAPECFITLLKEAGFLQVTLAGKTSYKTSANTIGALFYAVRP